MDAERKNYYDILDVEMGASPNQIEQAYLRARNAYSSDSVALYSLMTREECEAILNQIEEAYSVLGFPEKRKEYDRVRGFNKNDPSSSEKSEARVVPDVQYEDYSSNLMEAKVSKISAQKKFALEFQEDSEMNRRIRECSEFTGSFLKEIREYKNVSIERMAEMTRISKTLIKAIETEDLPKLPAEVYVRGYVYQLAKVLKLNPEMVAASFILHYKKLKSQNNG